MRLTDILLALTLVVTSSMAVVPPSKTIQTPQSNQNPRCRPGPSNICQPTVSSPNNERELKEQTQKRYEDLQKRVERAKIIMGQSCGKHYNPNNKSASSQTGGGLGLGSFFARFVPDSARIMFGKPPINTEHSKRHLDPYCVQATKVYNRVLTELIDFKRTHNIGFMAKLYNFMKWFKK
ncbi:hypothetical protein BDEG_28683 [Batrachochytrium dendrobatidis JEL423]|uniref:Uncharacterized protein n=1 Tax=Batrachochytrium dendrobatidis (strain JEL423) TaxID=403673 RepID=A0A177VZF2_BATDL|nr:hypothetical protein BDEG_28683 [Batrachochytrium dendrobatidis JEL423]